jgi:gamma-glutamyltranspeptidase/glutathione hydrolase
VAKALVAATDPVARAGGEAIIEDGGSASDAVVAAILSAAAVRSGVLLGPLVAMVGGVGAGTTLFDGRTCQPGLGEKRPRGFMADDRIPLAARCAVPRGVAALALVHAYSTKRPWSALVRSARATAKQQDEVDDGLDARLEVLDALPAHGAPSLTQLAGALIRAAGPGAGGLLSARDLEEARPADSRPSFEAMADAELARPVWSDAVGDEETRSETLQRTHVVVAADGRGLVAAASYTPFPAGLLVPELGLRLASAAVPVRRGVPRVTPGTPLWAPSPIALLQRAADGWFGAMGASGAETIPDVGLASTALPLDKQLEALLSATGAAAAAIATVERGETAASAAVG